MKFIVVLLLFCSILFSCSRNENVGRYALLRIAQKLDPTVEPLLAETLSGGLRCVKVDGTPVYGEGCIGAFKVKVQLLDITVLEFKSFELAEKEAKRLGQYHYKNWVFDEVAGEPVLENFVKKAFGAQKGMKEESN